MTAFPQAINASASPEVGMNENFLALQALGTYSHNAVADSGLVRGYSGGRWGGFAVSDVAHTFGASATTYVCVKLADGSLDFSTSSAHYTTAATYAKVETVVTGTAAVTSITDDRAGPGGIYGSAGGTSVTIDTDGTLAANSDTVVASQKATRTFVLANGGTALGWLDVKAGYGAKIDGRRVTDAVCNSTSTVTSASAAFVSGDVGKLFEVENATGSAVFESTISAVGSSTSVTLAGAVPFTATGCAAVLGTDDTTAVQNAITAAGAAGGGTIFFPHGICCIGGALQDTSRSNAQITLPKLHAVNAAPITICMRGAFAPAITFSVVGATPLPVGHSIIKSFLNTGSGTAPCAIGAWGPSGSFDNLTNILLVWRDLAVRLPSNPVLTACDFSHVCGVDLDGILVDCGNYYVQGLTQPTTTTSFGIRCPETGNAAYTKIGAVNVIGFYKGYEFAEHTNGAQVVAWGCYKAFNFVAADHASHFDRLMAVHCTTILAFTGGAHYVEIDELDIEHAASGWWVTANDIDDASNYGHGSAPWHVVLAGVGTDHTFTVNGATGMSHVEIGTSAAPAGPSLNAQSSAYTLVLGDANGIIYHPAADTTARTWTIPANSSVAFPVGTIETFDNDIGAGVLTIAITTDTMILVGAAGSTGSRTIAAGGQATAVKVTSTRWRINGTLLT